MTTFVIAMTLLLACMSTLLLGSDWLDRVSEHRLDRELPHPVRVKVGDRQP